MPRKPRKQLKKIYTSPIDVRVDEILRFDSYRDYIGGLSLEKIERWQDSQEDFPVLEIGHIDKNTICNKLWELMSLNPLRYGTVSPFLFDGKNDIYQYTKGKYPSVKNGRGAMGNVAHYLNKYMQYNGLNKNGVKQWDADLSSDKGGVVYPSELMQAALIALIYAFAKVADQNQDDFQRPKYHESILNAVSARYKLPQMQTQIQPQPQQVKQDITPVVPAPQHGVVFDKPVAKIRAHQTTGYSRFDSEPILKYNVKDSEQLRMLADMEREYERDEFADTILGNTNGMSPEIIAQALLDKGISIE